MLSTHRDIALVAADLDLRSFFDRVPLLIGAEIHGGLGATVANRLELGESVGPLVRRLIRRCLGAGGSATRGSLPSDDMSTEGAI
ncbi:MAG: hypothetical protein ACJAVK_003039 [Akkermansiaceae bacterium]|jgi:hypothetical protein